MEMAYIQAENLKHKRTFTKTLIVLAPFVTALMNFFAHLWFQLNSYNWWYILLYPGFLTLTCALIEQRDNGKLKYRAVVASLPVSQNKVWKAKNWSGRYLLLCGEFHFPGAKSVGRFCNISYQRNSPDNRNLAGCGRNSLYCHCKPMGSSAVLMVIKKSWYLCHGYS